MLEGFKKKNKVNINQLLKPSEPKDAEGFNVLTKQ